MTKKIGLIGAGLVGPRHAKTISTQPQCELTAILATGEVESRRLAAEHGASYFTSSKRFFANDYDGLVIATPNETHGHFLNICAEKGIPALVEKPLFSSTSDLDYLTHDNEEYFSKNVLVGHHRHHYKKIQLLKSMISKGQLGELTAINGLALLYKPDEYFEQGPWRKNKNIGGVGLINLTHDLGIFRFLCGEIVEFEAFKSNSNRGFSAEETIALLLKFENGCLGSLIVSDCSVSPYSWELTVGENPAYPKQDQNCYIISGTEATVSFPSMTVNYYSKRKSWWDELLFRKEIGVDNDPFQEQMRHFLDVIDGRTAPLVSFADALKTLKIVESITK
jgi:predicted dehydrogenase